MDRCPYCFKPLPENGICDCHYEESENALIEDALRPGTVVGAGYLIGAVLGKGGFGITYRAFDLNLKSVVAIKEFYPEGMVTRAGLVNTETANKYTRSQVLALTDRNQRTYRKSLELFYREAEALGKLNRLPNVVHAYQFFRENGTAYIVMDFVEGKSLKAVINDRGRIPESELLPLLDPILKVLDKVHEAGILHRDIAPDNIMIENGVPVLVDFGAARVEEGHASSLLIGKKGYSSPEQMAGGEIGPRSDIYSMGATYYKALSGITPQDSGLRALKDQIKPPEQIIPGISKKVSDAVMKAMAVDVDQRFESAKAFQTALNGGGSAGGGDDSEDEQESVPAQKSKKAKTGWILMAVLLVFAAVGIYLFRDQIIPKSTPTVDTAALTQSVNDASQTVEEAMVRTRQAERARQTENAVKAAESAAQTETAFYNAKKAELRQTETRLAENLLATQAYFENRTEEAGIRETQAAVETGQAAEATQAAAAWLATQQAELALTQTQEALDRQRTQTVIAEQTARAEETAAAAESTHQAYLRQTETRSALQQQNTQTAEAEGTAYALQTADAFEQTQQAMSIAQTQFVETQSAFALMQTENARKSTAEALAFDQTAFAQTQEVFSAMQTKAAEPTSTATNTPKPTSTPRPTLTKTPKPTTTPRPTVTKTPLPITAQLKVGDLITFGRYEQDNNKANGAEPIEWQVLAVEDDRALVISRYALDTKPYNEKYESVTWETSTLRAWLNGEFYETVFSAEEKGRIQQVTNENPDNSAWRTKGGSRTQDRIFLLSIEEVNKYFASDEARKCWATDYAKENGASVSVSYGMSRWWLRSPGDNSYYAASVLKSGYVGMYGSVVNYPLAVVRPAFWLNLTASENNGEIITIQRTNTPKPTSTPKATATLDPESLYQLGNDAYWKEDYSKALEYLIPAAEAGNSAAQFYLGYMYVTGQGVPKSDEKAVEWYQKAANQGNVAAQFNLGYMYGTGQGVPQSDEKAVELYQKAADQGDAYAQCNLGVMYANGQGVPQSYEKAAEWFRKSADQGYYIAQYFLGHMYETGLGVTQSYEKAREWYQKAADQGYGDAQEALDRLS